MKYIGAHVSISGGIEKSVQRAKDLSATAYALFLKNQRQWQAKPYSTTNIEQYQKLNKENNFSFNQILPHAGYLINMATSETDKREKMFNALLDEVSRCQQLNLNYLNIHPGSHLNKISYKEAIALIAEAIDFALAQTNNFNIVLETTAGQGSSIGHKFEELADIIAKSNFSDRIFICYDTCHSFTAGYDIRDEKSYLKTMDEFEKILGFKKLKGMHLNDSLKPFNSNLDRHASIGEGYIGNEAFKLLMADDRIDNIPLILETPNSELWIQEIEMLKSWVK